MGRVVGGRWKEKVRISGLSKKFIAKRSSVVKNCEVQEVHRVAESKRTLHIWVLGVDVCMKVL